MKGEKDPYPRALAKTIQITLEPQNSRPACQTVRQQRQETQLTQAAASCILWTPSTGVTRPQYRSQKSPPPRATSSRTPNSPQPAFWHVPKQKGRKAVQHVKKKKHTHTGRRTYTSTAGVRQDHSIREGEVGRVAQPVEALCPSPHRLPYHLGVQRNLSLPVPLSFLQMRPLDLLNPELKPRTPRIRPDSPVNTPRHISSSRQAEMTCFASLPNTTGGGNTPWILQTRIDEAIYKT